MEKTKFASSTKLKYQNNSNGTYTRKRTKSRAKKIFESIDENGDGKVSKHEFLEWHRPSLEQRFKQLDTNGDGSITLEEFENNFRAFKRWYTKSKIGYTIKPKSKSFQFKSFAEETKLNIKKPKTAKKPKKAKNQKHPKTKNH